MESWLDEYDAAITICDLEGVILYANEKSKSTFSQELIGYNLIECHPEPARTKLLQMLKEPMVNVYTIEKNGVKKMIRQSPWYKDGQFSGVVEISIVIPFEMPHFIRTPKE